MKLLIEGWRGINHSYALVNQNQTLQLLRLGVEVFHRDVPYFNGRWNPNENPSGFTDANAQLLAGLKPYDGEPIDCIYRISYPYRMDPADGRTFTFGTAEYQRVDRSMIQGSESFDLAAATHRTRIVTPSNWSAIGFLNLGFPERSVAVVPHGVDPDAFHPLEPDERILARKRFGIAEDAFVFTNIGAMTANKGIDVLLRAFAILRKRYPNLRLVLKDQSKLYGLRAQGLIDDLTRQARSLVDQGLLASITQISDNLDLESLRLLYGATDAYVSPYRAEGFNLTPLEAAACGTPIIVTKGGSTDDYCTEAFSLTVDADARRLDGGGAYLEPSLESLVARMQKAMFDSSLRARARAEGSHYVRTRFSWETVTRKLVLIMSG